MASPPRQTHPTVLSLVAALALAAPVWAGPLFPPGGEPTSTMKRLDEVSLSRCISSLPFVITEPGTYDLCGNLSGGSNGKSAITVASSGVVIDLKGFTLTGAEGSGRGIEVLPGFSSVTVRNGTMNTWGGGAIYAPEVSDARCADLSVSSCGGEAAVWIAGGRVERCVISSSGVDGLRVSALSGGGGGAAAASYARVSSTSSSSNGGNGFSFSGVSFDTDSCVTSRNLGSGVQVILPVVAKAQDHNSSRSNKSSSIDNGGDGFLVLAGEGSVASIDLDGCNSSGNTGVGVRVVCGPQDEVTVRLSSTTCSSNDSSGVFVQDALVELERCVIENNTSHGLHLASNASAKAPGHNSTRSNRSSGVATGGNGGDGILLESLGTGFLSFVCVDTSSSSNGGHGLRCEGGASIDVDRCVMSGNTVDGVRLSCPASAPVRASFSNTRLSDNTGAGLSCPSVEGEADVRLSSCVIDRCGAEGVQMVASSSAPGEMSLSLDRCEVTRCAGAGVVLLSAIGPTGPSPASLRVSSSQLRGSGGPGASVVCTDAEVHASTVSGNGGGGLVCGSTTHFRSSSSSFTGNEGVGLSVSCPVIDLSSVSCVSNSSSGASLSGDSLSVSSSSFSRNQGIGLQISGAGHVVGNVVANNREVGILVSSSGLSLSDNVVSGHRSPIGDGAGIRVNAPGNRIVGNLFEDCDDAVALYANNNPVYQNSSAEGVNPLFESPGVSGNGAPNGGVSTSTNPFTNILH